MDQDELKRFLSETPVTAIRAYEEIGSTNDEALAWLEEDAPDFALVIADSQTKGRGRFERNWTTFPGTSLAFTVIFRPTEGEMDHPTTLYAPMCGLAVQQTMKVMLGLPAQIKWPNDVLIERQKCCGILVEAVWTGSRLTGVVMGIGINVSQGSLPPNALFPATWLEKYTHGPVDRNELLAAVLKGLAYWRPRLGSDEFFEDWKKNLAFLGEPVRIEQKGEAPQLGSEIGIDDNGNLLLLDASGATITVEVGDVHLRSAVSG